MKPSSTEAVAEFADKLAQSLEKGTFVRLTLTAPKRGPDEPEKVLVRCVELRGARHLSFTSRHGTQDVTKNLPLDEGVQWVRERLGGAFRGAFLGTTERDWQFVLPTKGKARVISHNPAVTAAPPRAHDQSHKTLLDDSASDWLRGLGIIGAGGKVRAEMADKYRQIAYYLEILSHQAKDCGWRGAERQAPQADDSPPPPKIVPSQSSAGQGSSESILADMGCGKGYLTFGAWHLFRRVWKLPVRVIGVEARPELVRDANSLARRISADGLEFVTGSIQTVKLPAVDALIALHACDTATDDAIRRGIEWGARLIMVAPCCQKELRPQLGKPEPLAPVLRHGLMQERMADWLTDGLRALFLEWAGYRAKMFEFVAPAHTPKNLMISAARHARPFADLAARQRICDLKAFFNIQSHALDSLLDQHEGH